MLVVRQGTVKHDGENYVAGQILPDMTRKEAQRLLRLGVAAEVEEAKPADAPKPPKNTRAPKTMPAPPAPPAPPAEEGGPATPATPGEGQGDDEDDDEGGEGQPPVDLSINPAENIKAKGEK